MHSDPLAKMHSQRRLGMPRSLFGNLVAKPEYLKAYVSRMDRNALIPTLCKLNMLTSGYSIRQNDAYFQALAVQLLYKDGIISLRDRDRIAKFFSADDQRWYEYTIFSRTNLLALLQAMVLSDGSATVSWAEAGRRGDFFRALMVCCDIDAEFIIENRLQVSDAWDEMAVQILPFIRQTAQLGAPTTAPMIYLGRAKLLLFDEFLNRYTEYGDPFLKIFGFHPETYLKIAAAVLKTLIPRGIEVQYYTTFNSVYEFSLEDVNRQCADVPMADVQKFLSQFSQTTDELAGHWRENNSSFNLQPLRSKPILQLTNKRYMPVDELFLCEAMAIGPLFRLVKKCGANQVFSDFGKSFERYVSMQLADYHEGIATELHWTEGDSEQGHSFDVWINYGVDVLVGEIKSGWLRDEDLREPDSRVFWNSVKNSYVCSKEGRPKGIGQLARTVQMILENRMPTEFPSAHNASVFPVLIVHDTFLRGSYFGLLLALEFWRILGKHGTPRTGFEEIEQRKIYSPIIITIRDLEHYQSMSPKISLAEILRKYSDIDPLRQATIRIVESELQMPLQDDTPRICRAAKEIAGDFI